MKNLLILASTLVLVILLALVVLFREPDAAVPPITERSAPAVLFIGTDSSNSFKPSLPAVIQVAAALATSLNPSTDWVTSSRFDSDYREFRSDKAPIDPDHFADEMVTALEPPARQEGTHFELYFPLVASRAKECAGSIGIVCFTDGYPDRMRAKGHALVLDAAKSLDANSRVKVVTIVGANPETWDELRRDLAPLGEKLRFFPLTDVDVQAIVAAIKGGRS